MQKYNVLDEYNRLIDENVSLQRALLTAKENKGSTIKIVKELTGISHISGSLSNKKKIVRKDILCRKF